MDEFKKMLWWLVGGTKGGKNRLRIIKSLEDNPKNANQLSEGLDLDYKTVKHHLDILVKHDVITTIGEGYGITYFLTDRMEQQMDKLDEIIEEVGIDL